MYRWRTGDYDVLPGAVRRAAPGQDAAGGRIGPGDSVGRKGSRPAVASRQVSAVPEADGAEMVRCAREPRSPRETIRRGQHGGLLKSVCLADSQELVLRINQRV